MHQLEKNPTKQRCQNPSYSNSPLRNQPNSHNDPNLQLSISTGKPDHMSKPLGAIKKWPINSKSQIKTTNHTMLRMIIITLV